MDHCTNQHHADLPAAINKLLTLRSCSLRNPREPPPSPHRCPATNSSTPASTSASSRRLQLRTRKGLHGVSPMKEHPCRATLLSPTPQSAEGIDCPSHHMIRLNLRCRVAEMNLSVNQISLYVGQRDGEATSGSHFCINDSLAASSSDPHEVTTIFCCGHDIHGVTQTAGSAQCNCCSCKQYALTYLFPSAFVMLHHFLFHPFRYTVVKESQLKYSEFGPTTVTVSWPTAALRLLLENPKPGSSMSAASLHHVPTTR
jgi:hypothetical protein